MPLFQKMDGWLLLSVTTKKIEMFTFRVPTFRVPPSGRFFADEKTAWRRHSELKPRNSEPMTLRSFLFLLMLLIGSARFAAAQTPPPPRIIPEPTPMPRISETLAKNLEGLTPGQEIARDKREQAYVKLLEGQRFNWSAGRLRSQAALRPARSACCG